MSINECLKMFQVFAQRAFTGRIGVNLHGIRYLVEAQHHSKYESKGLEESLKEFFGERKMFGEAAVYELSSQKPSKVGVTMTTSSGRPYLVANYNRTTRKNCMYCHPAAYVYC